MKKEEIKISKEDLIKLLHIATNNIKDFVTDNDRFLNEHLQQETPKEKCEGCKRAEFSDTIYTCSCGV